MRLPRETQVLALMACLASTMLSLSGCVGLGKSSTTSSLGVTSIAVSPSAVSPAPSAKVQFTAAIQGTTTNNAVTWTASVGSITSAGVFTAPANRVTGMVIATSVADPTKSATATVTVGGLSVSVSPATASSATGGTLSFSAAVV